LDFSSIGSKSLWDKPKSLGKKNQNLITDMGLTPENLKLLPQSSIEEEEKEENLFQSEKFDKSDYLKSIGQNKSELQVC